MPKHGKTNDVIYAGAMTHNFFFGIPMGSFAISFFMTFLLAYNVWGQMKFSRDIWIFLPLFVIVFFVSFYLTWKYGRWKVDQEALYLGNNRVLSLHEIEAARVGLPEGWLTSMAKVPGLRFSRSGRLLMETANSRDEMLILRLTNDRWFFWPCLRFNNAIEVRDRLRSAAREQTIEHVPPQLLRLIRARTVLKNDVGR